MTRSWVLPLLVVVGCAGARPTVRRPLVTDATPLGTTTDATVQWFQHHGWCFDVVERDRARAHYCHPGRPVIAVLGFRDGHLARAAVRYRVAGDLFDTAAGLADELERRHGRPDDRSGVEPMLVWTTSAERIVLYAERNRAWIVERHTPAAAPEEPYQPWVVDDFWIVEHSTD